MIMNERAEVLTPTESRQASPRKQNFRVLIISTGLAIVVAAIVYYAIYANPQSQIGVPQVTSEEPAVTGTRAPESPAPTP
jgi:hypothetical protein